MNHEEEPVALRSIFRKARARGSGSSANMARILDIEELEGLDIDEIEIDGPNTPTPRAHRFEDLQVPHAPTPPLPVGKVPDDTNVQIVSQITPTSANVDDAVKVVSGIESPTAGSVEELVPIKPRARRPRTNAPSQSGTLADRIPEVERYDPQLTSNQLRVEGGQLRDRRDRNRARTLLLPSVFKPKYSAGTDDYPDIDIEDDLSEAQRRAVTGAIRVDEEGKLRRKSMADQGNFGHIIECYAMDTTEALMALTRLLKHEFAGTHISAGTSELRIKVPIPLIAPNTHINIVVGTSGKWNGGCTLAFRKSLTDRSKLEPRTFMHWVESVRRRMREMDEEQDASG